MAVSTTGLQTFREPPPLANVPSSVRSKRHAHSAPPRLDHGGTTGVSLACRRYRTQKHMSACSTTIIRRSHQTGISTADLRPGQETKSRRRRTADDCRKGKSSLQSRLGPRRNFGCGPQDTLANVPSSVKSQPPTHTHSFKTVKTF